MEEVKEKRLGIDDVKKIIANYYDTAPSNVSIDFSDQRIEFVIKPVDITNFMYRKQHEIILSDAYD